MQFAQGKTKPPKVTIQRPRADSHDHAASVSLGLQHVLASPNPVPLSAQPLAVSPALGVPPACFQPQWVWLLCVPQCLLVTLCTDIAKDRPREIPGAFLQHFSVQNPVCCLLLLRPEERVVAGAPDSQGPPSCTLLGEWNDHGAGRSRPGGHAGHEPGQALGWTGWPRWWLREHARERRTSGGEFPVMLSEHSSETFVKSAVALSFPSRGQRPLTERCPWGCCQ